MVVLIVIAANLVLLALGVLVYRLFRFDPAPVVDRPLGAAREIGEVEPSGLLVTVRGSESDRVPVAAAERFQGEPDDLTALFAFDSWRFDANGHRA